jgi:hypothetical protein
VAVGGLLLALAFVILVHLLLAPPAVPGTHADENPKSKKNYSSTTHNDGAQPPPSAEEQGEAFGCPNQDENNCGDHESHRSDQAYHT